MSDQHDVCKEAVAALQSQLAEAKAWRDTEINDLERRLAEAKAWRKHFADSAVRVAAKWEEGFERERARAEEAKRERDQAVAQGNREAHLWAQLRGELVAQAEHFRAAHAASVAREAGLRAAIEHIATLLDSDYVLPRPG